MEKLLVFGILSLAALAISWRTIFNIYSHGFYRFFCWECIFWLFVSNCRYWFDDPLSTKQIFSWICLFYSSYLLISGLILMRKIGKPGNRANKTLYKFEKTSVLVQNGIFKYIRHPLCSSLLFFTWGLFLKNTTYSLFLIAMMSTVFIYLIAIFDERECMRVFGDKYSEYAKERKRFIPFVI
jgi:protein-S-isoprenylcysteine O-methyltransferase Ste14